MERKNILQNENINQVLRRVVNTPEMTLFHENSYVILKLLEMIPENMALKSQFYMGDRDAVLENSIIIDGVKYYFNEEMWDKFHKMIVKRIDEDEMGSSMIEIQYPVNNIEKEEEIVKPLKTDLKTKIQKTIKNIEVSKNIMYREAYKNILQFPKFDAFLQHLLVNSLNAIRKDKKNIKYTNFNYQIGDSIMRFVIVHMPKIEAIFNCFESNKPSEEVLKVTKEEITEICKFVETILKNDLLSKEVITIFEELHIRDRKLQKILYYFFDDLLYRKFKKNNIKIMELQDIINKNITRLNHTDNLNKELINLGAFLTSYLIDEEIFELDREFRKKENKKGKNDKAAYILKPTPDIMEAVQNTYAYHKPFLIEKQLQNLKWKKKKERIYQIIDQKINKFVHSNPRITLQIKSDSYLKKIKASYKKYGIYQNYLIFLLQFLCINNPEFDYLYLGAIYELNELTKIQDSILQITDEAIRNKIQEIYAFLFNELKDFSQCRSASQAFKYIKKVYKYDITKIKDNTHNELKDFINKIYQRKNTLVTLIRDAISLCIFESFLHSTFIDARGRYYLNAASTNMHTHLAARLLIRLHDETYQNPPTEEVFILMKKHLNFKATQDQIDNLILEKYDINYEKENTKRRLSYIESYFKPKTEWPINMRFDLAKVLQEPLYEDTTYLLWNLSFIVKKPKRLFYVHSLLFYERERIKNMHPKHLINHYELDASSSGLQMMSGLFHSTNLAKMCNLISDEQTQDIYTVMTQLFLKTWKNLMLFLTPMKGWASLTKANHQHTIWLGNQFEDDGTEDIFEYSLLEWLTLSFKDSKDEDKTTKHLSHLLRLNHKDFFKKSPLYTKEIFDLIESRDKVIYNKLIKKAEFKGYEYEIRALLIFRMIWRLYFILKDDFKLGVEEFANNRELFKKPIMTYFYKSTSHGRKIDYEEYFHSLFPITATKEMKSNLNELINFLDRFFVASLKQMRDVDLMNQLISKINLKTSVTISNKNFLIYIEPKVQIKRQIQCPNIGGQRGLQLTIRKTIDQINTVKMKSMLGANIIHSMDAHIVHTLNELLLNINEDLKNRGLRFKLIHDTNHDCFYFSCPFLLRIFIEECYLSCFFNNYLDNISGISDETKKELLQLSTDKFINALSPINELFIK